MVASRTAIPIVSAKVARGLFLAAQGLTADPARKAGPAAVQAEVERLGYVQIDSINVVERAHHHILMSRLDGYRPAMSTKLLERDRTLFEHWTHDAAMIPIDAFPHWRHRFGQFPAGAPPPDSHWGRRIGDDPKAVLRHVVARIRKEGPLMSADFEHARERGRGKWWDWKPQKTALEYLWHAGKLAISGRLNFHKQYDLVERVIPDAERRARPRRAESIAWACGQALDRLVFATPKELAHFYDAVTIAEAQAWCARAERRGEIEPVLVEHAQGSSPRRCYARTGWQQAARRAANPPDRMRLLSPFDPVLRDRDRTRALFGFEYRFEAFVPAAKRRYGYYVMPVLAGDALTGRVDAKLHRNEGRLAVRGPWWEEGSGAKRSQQRSLEDAVERFAQQVGAEKWSVESP